METIAAVILAAGGSTRLGQPKQLLLHLGESLVHRAARVAREAGCSPVIVVVGDEREPIAMELRMGEAHVTHHPDWRLGIGSSIRAGVAHALAQSPVLEAIVIMVCDQPFLSADTLKALMAARAQTQNCAAACLYAGSIGVPAIFDRSLFPLLTTLPDAQGAQSILAARSGESHTSISRRVTSTSTHRMTATSSRPVPFPHGSAKESPAARNSARRRRSSRRP
jgi:molybdenum cofactor cytidylyltransferase